MKAGVTIKQFELVMHQINDANPPVIKEEERMTMTTLSFSFIT